MIYISRAGKVIDLLKKISIGIFKYSYFTLTVFLTVFLMNVAV